MAGQRFIRTHVNPKLKLINQIKHFIFAYGDEYRDRPDIVIISGYCYHDFINEYQSINAYNVAHENYHVNGVKVIYSDILKKTEIEIY